MIRETNKLSKTEKSKKLKPYPKRKEEEKYCIAPTSFISCHKYHVFPFLK